MSKLLSPVDWLWVNCFLIKGQCCMFLNEWMNCLLLLCSLSEALYSTASVFMSSSVLLRGVLMVAV